MEVGHSRKNVFGINGRITLMGGDRYTPMPEGYSFEDMMRDPRKVVPQDGAHPYSKQLGMNPGFAFSVKYTVNRQRSAHHFILEFLQMRSFQGQTFNLHSHEIVNKYTTLQFPNIAYRIEF